MGHTAGDASVGVDTCSDGRAMVRSPPPLPCSGKGPLMKSVIRLTAILTLVSLATLIAKANY